MRKIAVWAFTGLSITIATASCAPSTSINSRKDANYDGEPRRTLAVFWMQPWKDGIGDAEFHEMLSQRLGRCGISSAYVSKYRNGNSTPEFDSKFIEADSPVDGFNEDSRLLIIEKSVHYWRSNGKAYYNTYDVKFIDKDKRKIVWSGDVSLNSANTIRVAPHEKAEALSKDIINHLIKDGIIRTCPPDDSAR